jgi:hypothetical protein
MTALVTGSKPFDAPCRRPGPGASHPITVGTGPAVGQYSFIVYIPPILLASILFDRGSGFFATALSALLVALMVDWQADPVRHAAPPHPVCRRFSLRRAAARAAVGRNNDA